MAAGIRVALGGTFDPVHDRHRRLFQRAFEFGDVTVGLTSDELAPRTSHEERYVRPFDRRRHDLTAELDQLAEDYGRVYEVRELTEPTGIAIEPQFDVLVVSPRLQPAADGSTKSVRIGGSTRSTSRSSNVYAEDGEIISSTRIVNGEIDEHCTLTPERDGRPPRSETGR